MKHFGSECGRQKICMWPCEKIETVQEKQHYWNKRKENQLHDKCSWIHATSKDDKMSSKEQLISAKIKCYCSMYNNVKIAHKTSNTIQKILAYKITGKIYKFNSSGIYQLNCQNCGKKYTGQTGGSFHRRSFKYRNSNSTFAKHLYVTGHSFGLMEHIKDTLHFVK